VIGVEFVVIDTTEQGTWMLHDRDLDMRAELGEEGPARVRLRRDFAAAAWVNDMGHLRPETYPRNVFGSCVLATLGAAPVPYAGPVLITGWDPVDEIVDVDAERMEHVIDTVRLALAIDPDPTGVVHDSPWAKRLRKHADKVRVAPAPTMRVIGGWL
jgi:hypothetical protein